MSIKHLFKSLLYLSLSITYSSASTAVTDEEFKALQDQLNALADSVEQKSTNHQSATHIGGYGELHYNNLDSGREIDFHRFVLFVSHEFSDKIRLFSELEVEHALVGDGGAPGEVELEQAFIQFDISDQATINAGLFLIPVGILNETHEPPTFYGVERNPVEKNIIPVTWWEGGIMYSCHFNNGLSYDVALTSGLNGGVNIRGGRQKVAEAVANNLAVTTRLKYTGIAGVELAGTLQVQDDLTQDKGGDAIDGATLIELHAVVNEGPVTVKALYAQWDIDGATPAATNEDTQDGMYIEAAYKLNSKVGVFSRYNIWDNGGLGDTEETQTDFGVNYWPHEDVVIKADYQLQNTVAGNDEGFNLGIGFQY